MPLWKAPSRRATSYQIDSRDAPMRFWQLVTGLNWSRPVADTSRFERSVSGLPASSTNVLSFISRLLGLLLGYELVERIVSILFRFLPVRIVNVFIKRLRSLPHWVPATLGGFMLSFASIEVRRTADRLCHQRSRASHDFREFVSSREHASMALHVSLGSRNRLSDCHSGCYGSRSVTLCRCFLV